MFRTSRKFWFAIAVGIGVFASTAYADRPSVSPQVKRVTGPVPRPWPSEFDDFWSVEKGIEVFKRYDRSRKLRVEMRGARYKFIDDNGQVIELGEYDAEGKRHGVRKRYRREGTMDFMETWSHGQLDGQCKAFHFNGKPRTEVSYASGTVVSGKKYRLNGALEYTGSEESEFLSSCGELKDQPMHVNRKLFK